MTTWYSKVECYERFAHKYIIKRKIDLDGWKDRPEVAYYLIGQPFDYRNKIDDKYMKDFETFKEHILYLDDAVTIKPDGIIVPCEEWNTGVANSKEKASEYFDLAKSDCDPGASKSDEW